jgi:tRNA (mo5U34)-methyltransferase
MTRDQLISEVAKISWFHSIDLGGGVVTPGWEGTRTKEKLSRLGLPEDLAGLSVLDIGAWDGFFSFEAERRGAARVLATDSYSWSGEGWGTKDGFRLARNVLRSKVEDKDIDVLDISPETVGMFDLVLFLGVLYHLRHPLLGLERVYSVTKGQLILETHVQLSGKRPLMAFYPGSELYGDPTNWWGPNPAAIAAMLRTVGFRKVQIFSSSPPFYGRLIRAVKQVLKDGLPFLPNFRAARMVFHAWR